MDIRMSDRKNEREGGRWEKDEHDVGEGEEEKLLKANLLETRAALVLVYFFFQDVNVRLQPECAPYFQRQLDNCATLHTIVELWKVHAFSCGKSGTN